MLEVTQPRKAVCDCCGKIETEVIYGDGFPGWNHILWLIKNKKHALICPTCTKKISHFIKGKADFVDKNKDGGK